MANPSSCSAGSSGSANTGATATADMNLKITPKVLKQALASTSRRDNLPYLSFKKSTAKPVSVVTYGLPDDSFLLSSAFGINIGLTNYDEMFRMLKITDVGEIKMASTTNVALNFSFSFISKKMQFNNLITNIANYSLGTWSEIKFALIDDGFSMSFNNSYGESFLEKLNNITSTMAGDIRQLTNFYEKARQSVKAIENSFIGKMGGFLEKGLGAIPLIGGMLKGGIENAKYMIGHIAAADRAALPKVWRGSGMNNQYSFRVMLSALSEDPKEIEEKILVPIIILTTLATPIGQSSYWFNYPFLIQCEIEGLREIKAGYISDLQFSFGSGNSFFSKDKKYILVEAQFTINDLYSVMITPSDASFNNTLIPNTADWFRYIKKYIK